MALPEVSSSYNGRLASDGRRVEVKHALHRRFLEHVWTVDISTRATLIRQGPPGTGLNEVENGIMSIPRITAGKNTIHLKVADAASVKGPLEIVYRYQTNCGEAQHRQVIQPRDFVANVATYSFDAPELFRCNSILIRY